MEILPNYLFGNYVLELSRWFSQRFQIVKYDQTMEPKTLQVFYGQPRAAFRYLTEKFNGKIVLPMLNFYMANPTRDLLRERPGVVITDLESYDPVSKTVGRVRVPMHFNVTWSVNLWTDTLVERDYIMHEILQMMPGGEITLIFFTDFTIVNGKMIIGDRTQYILMPVKMGESFNDETEIETLEQQQVRERIKTTFELTTHSIIPYNLSRVPVFDSFEIIVQMVNQPTSKQIFTEEDFK
jgi:hypothetical protein